MQVDHPNEESKQQCKHERCTCEVDAGHPYCSDYCRNAAEFTEEPSLDEDIAQHGQCGCGHPQCRPQ